MTTAIPVENISKLSDKIRRLNRRADRLGVPALEMTVGEPYFVEDGADHYKVADVTITGNTIQIEGWEIVGMIDHLEVGNIVKTVGDNEIDLMAYRNVGPDCHHCKMDRRRNKTYILSDGETLIQVGGSCLQDFLGHDPKAALWYASILADIEEDVEKEFGGHGVSYFPLIDLLSVTASIIRTDGWVSRSAAGYGQTPTVEKALLQLFPAKNTDILTPAPRDIEEAEKAIAWAQEIDPSISNDFLYNIHIISKAEYITYKQAGYAAAIVAAYQREQGKVAEAQTQESNWVGEVKDRLELTLTVTNIHYHEGRYGMTFITKLTDTNGNIFTWFASKELEVGETYTGKATIKKHDEYNGVKQTVITRYSVK